MNWETYYDKFYDWADSTQIRRLSDLTSFGPSEEVAEIAGAFFDEKAASTLILKALAYGVQFTAEDICELCVSVSEEVMNALLRASKCRFTREQLMELDCFVDEDLLVQAARRSGIRYLEWEEEEDASESLDYEESPESVDFPEAMEPPKSSGGLLACILGGLAINAVMGGRQDRKKRHFGTCTGDCGNCPPHYGYRYGRWYYGHHHAWGCEFNGNSCSGRE